MFRQLRGHTLIRSILWSSASDGTTSPPGGVIRLDS
jgi:hypothetical protein